MKIDNRKFLDCMIAEQQQQIVQHRAGIANCQQNIVQLKDTQKMYDKYLREAMRELMRLEKLRG